MTEIIARPASRRRCWLFVFLAGLALVSLVLHAVKWQRMLEVQGLFDQWATLAAARPIERVKAERSHFYETVYYLDYPVTVSYAVAGFLQRLSAVIRPLGLLNVQVDPGLRDLKFRLSVTVAAATSAAARQKLAVFIEKLRAFPELTQLSWSGRDADSPESGRHIFSVNGQLEWQ